MDTAWIWGPPLHWLAAAWELGHAVTLLIPLQNTWTDVEMGSVSESRQSGKEVGCRRNATWTKQEKWWDLRTWEALLAYWLGKAVTVEVREVNETQVPACPGAACRTKVHTVTELGFDCSSLKNPILRDKCWVEGKIALLRKPAILGRRWTHVPKNQLPIADLGTRVFKVGLTGVHRRGWGQGLHAEQHRQLWQSSWKWSCHGLTSIILTVLRTVNLQFQGQFVPISLRPVLRIV